MQFINRINGAKSFSEVQHVISQAKASNELKNHVLYAAIKKLDSKSCKNTQLGHELATRIPTETLASLDARTLQSILNCASQVYDFRLAHKVFLFMKDPNSYNFYYYINSFKNAKANELSPEMIEELGSLWKKVELSGNIEHDKLLNQLFCVLSCSKEKQRNLITCILSKPPNNSYTCGLMGNFLKYCTKVNDLDLARRIWDWGQSIRDRECGTFSFFQISYQFYTLFPPPLTELKSLWSQVKKSGLDCRVEVVTSMFKSLSFEVVEQRSFIQSIISGDPKPSFTCGLLGGFLKHCSETNDLILAEDIWFWGKSIRDREGVGTYGYFLITFQYFSLFPPPIVELKKLWNKVISCKLDHRTELINSMCKSLSGQLDEQEKFIASVISKKPNESFNCGLLGGFLKYCSETKDLKLAEDIWNWGKCIRDRERGTFWFFLITYQYYDLFPPSISELKSLWSRVISAQLGDRVELVTCMCSALSSNRKEQRKFIQSIISDEPKPYFTCSLLGGFLKRCSETKDLNLAQDVWLWGQPIRERERNTLSIFRITYQYFALFPPQISELKSLWSQVVRAHLDEREELVNSMSSALYVDRNEQRKFIRSIISKEPKPSFNCGILGGFLKQCSEAKDLNLGREIWKWGQPIIRQTLGENGNVLVTFQYFTLSKSVTEQRDFILHHISNPVSLNYQCGVIGTFLSYCLEQNNLELARKVWSWGLDIRRRCKGTSELGQLTIQYLSICGGTGDLSALEEVWKEATYCGVSTFMGVKGAFINALASNGAADRALELFSEVPSSNMDEYILTSTLNALSHAGRDDDALNILRRVQQENPKITSVISYTSVIDAFARNGNFEMAFSLTEEMKQFGIEPDAITWKTILSPCRFYKNLTVALKAFEELQKVEVEPKSITSAYVLLADVYKSCGDFATANQLHEERLSKGLFKPRGGVQLSLPNNETLSFYVNDIPSTLDPDICNQIYEILDGWRPILEQMGLSTESVYCRHSEMLALAYAIGVLKLESVMYY